VPELHRRRDAALRPGLQPTVRPGSGRTSTGELGIPLDRRTCTLSIGQIGRRTGALSGGQQARVALTPALAKRPDLLVLDKPVASLDPAARHEFLQVLMGAVTEGEVTVLFSSHPRARTETHLRGTVYQHVLVECETPNVYLVLVLGSARDYRHQRLVSFDSIDRLVR
jgi:ABC-type cobalamin transport system ATPase subunit